MEIAGYLSSILIGVALGLIGGGGSILTVPVLVYLFSIDAVSATAYSLFVVGTTSAAGSIAYFRSGLVSLRTAIIFGIPSVVAVFLTRTYIVPAIPHTIFQLGNFIVTRDLLLMILFAVLMIVASYNMISRPSPGINKAVNSSGYLRLLLQGIFVGAITGLIGAGGGFLIIPVLVGGLKMPMKQAIGTSLVIIAINSAFGFLSSLADNTVDWQLLLRITLIAMVGVLIGTQISKKLDGGKLKPVFGWFVLVMGIYIIIKETWLK
jgi:hypothetical protein